MSVRRRRGLPKFGSSRTWFKYHWPKCDATWRRGSERWSDVSPSATWCALDGSTKDRHGDLQEALEFGESDHNLEFGSELSDAVVRVMLAVWRESKIMSDFRSMTPPNCGGSMGGTPRDTLPGGVSGSETGVGRSHGV